MTVGGSYLSDEGRQNVSIAFGSYIEDALGSDAADVIVGNAFSNVLNGGKENDLIVADGDAIATANSFAATGIVSTVAGDYRRIDLGILDPVGLPTPVQLSDTLIGGEGDDRVVGGVGGDRLDGGVGNDTLLGGEGDDTILSGAGTDLLVGSGGADLFVMDSGASADHATVQSVDVDDRIVWNGYILGGGAFTLIEGEIVTREYTSFTQFQVVDENYLGQYGEKYLINGSNLTIKLPDDSTVVLTGYAPGDAGLAFGSRTKGDATHERDWFWSNIVNDGSTFNYGDLGGRAEALATPGPVRAPDVTGGDGGDNMAGAVGSDAIAGLLGSDSLSGADGRDYLRGDDGDDTLIGGAQDDVLSGGLGDDVLFGGLGADVLDGGVGGLDTADYSLAASGVAVSLSPTDAQADGDGGRDILRGVEALRGSTFADHLAGNSLANVLEGGAGDDSLTGGSGNDVFLYASAQGDDLVTEASGGGVDTLRLGAGLLASAARVTIGADIDDVMLTFVGHAGGVVIDEQFNTGTNGVEEIVFGDGQVWVKADVQAAYLAQAQTSGNDVIRGFLNATTFSFAGLAGTDRINEGSDSGAIDRLLFGAGMTAASLTMVRSTSDIDDVTLSFSGQTGSLTLDEQFSGSSGIEEIVFGDGQTWTKLDLQNAYLARAQTAGNDVIDGFDGSTDITVLALAGADRIVEGSEAAAVDRLLFGAGLTSVDVVLARSTTDIDDVTLSFAGGSGSLMLEEQFNGSYGLETLVFGDGVTWTKADLMGAYLVRAQTSGNDVVYGFDGSTTIDFTSLQGADRLVEGIDSGATDRLVFGGGLLAANVVLTRPTTDFDDITISFSGQSGSILLDEQLNSGTYGVEEIEFGDGAVWTEADLKNAYLASVQTAANDVAYGFDTPDLLQGGLGNDALDGREGADTLVGGAGADTLTGGTGADVFRFEDVTHSAPGARDVLTALNLGSDKIDLTAIDADTILAGDQAFAWIGTAAFTAAGQIRYERPASNQTLFKADVNGDGVTDFELLVNGTSLPSANEFLL